MEKTQRRSRKRDAILEVLRCTKVHPAAEWVYTKLKADFPELSLGTVYRNLAQFQETGDIVRVAVVNGQDRYDADTREHAHFICARCGAVFDVDIPLDDTYVLLAGQVTGAVVTGARLTFGGLCAQCVSPETENTKINRRNL